MYESFKTFRKSGLTVKCFGWAAARFPSIKRHSLNGLRVAIFLTAPATAGFFACSCKIDGR
jgi:hypothetical protein